VGKFSNAPFWKNSQVLDAPSTAAATALTVLAKFVKQLIKTWVCPAQLSLSKPPFD